jgi:hypothetical protein
MSAEGKILVGLTIGGALVTGTLPQLLVGLAAGYIVYVCHKQMVSDELDEILRNVENKLSACGDNDDHRKRQLEKLREKVKAKKETTDLGSSLLGAGTVLCPIAGIGYIAARWAWKQVVMRDVSIEIDRRIVAARQTIAQFS